MIFTLRIFKKFLIFKSHVKKKRITDAGHGHFHRDHRPTVHSHFGQNAIAHVTDDVTVVLSELLRMRRNQQRAGRVEVRARRWTDVGQLEPGQGSAVRRRTCVRICEAQRRGPAVSRELFFTIRLCRFITTSRHLSWQDRFSNCTCRVQ